MDTLKDKLKEMNYDLLGTDLVSLSIETTVPPITTVCKPNAKILNDEVEVVFGGEEL